MPSAPDSRRKLVIGDDEPDETQNCGPRRSLLAAAGLWIVGSLGAAYAMGSTAWLVGTLATMLPLAGVVLGLGLPTSPEHPKAGRAAFIAAALLVLYLADPVTPLARLGAQRAFASADAVTRARLVRGWIDGGKVELAGLDLGGLDLAAANLAHTDLESSNLSNANLRDADLGGTNLRGARLTGANLGGAVLTAALVDDAVGFGEARCDDDTVMPADWHCADGHPAPEML